MTLLDAARAAFDPIPPPAVVEGTFRRIATWIPVTREMAEDANALQPIIATAFWHARLYDAGFLGFLRCDRCRRRTRCIYRRGDRLYGRTCYEKAAA